MKVADPDRHRVLDQRAQHTVALGQPADLRHRLLVHADLEELLVQTVRTDHPERGVPGSGNLLRRLDDPLQHTGQGEFADDGTVGSEQRTQPIIRCPDLGRHGRPRTCLGGTAHQVSLGRRRGSALTSGAQPFTGEAEGSWVEKCPESVPKCRWRPAVPPEQPFRALSRDRFWTFLLESGDGWRGSNATSTLARLEEDQELWTISSVS